MLAWAWILFLNLSKALDVELGGINIGNECKFMIGYGWKTQSVDFKGVAVVFVGVLRRLIRPLFIVRILGGANDSPNLLLGLTRAWYKRKQATSDLWLLNHCVLNDPIDIRACGFTFGTSSARNVTIVIVVIFLSEIITRVWAYYTLEA